MLFLLYSKVNQLTFASWAKDSFAIPWTAVCQAPLSMDFPGKNTGVGCHFLLQGIFPTQGSSPSLLHWQVNFFLPLSHLEAPFSHLHGKKFHEKFMCLSLWQEPIIMKILILNGFILLKVSAHSKDLEKWFSMEHISKSLWWTPLVVPCLRIYLPIQETWVQSLVQEDSTGNGQLKAMHQNYLADVVPAEPVCCTYWGPWV